MSVDGGDGNAYVTGGRQTLRYYIAADGGRPFVEWFDSLEANAAAKVTAALTRMSEGNLSHVKSVGDGTLEYRINYGPGYRLYFGRDGDTLIILLAGGTKRRQQRDIEQAISLWADYRRRKRGKR